MADPPFRIKMTSAEGTALDLTQRSLRAHAVLSATPPHPYADRFVGRRNPDTYATDTVPLASLDVELAEAFVQRDTVYYILPPPTPAAAAAGFWKMHDRDVLWRHLWRTWYPVRPINTRAWPQTFGGEARGDWGWHGWRFAGMPIHVKDLPSPPSPAPGSLQSPADEQQQQQQQQGSDDHVDGSGEHDVVATAQIVLNLHGILLHRIVELEPEFRAKHPYYHERGIRSVMTSAFVIMDRRPQDTGGENGIERIDVLLAITKDAAMKLMASRELRNAGHDVRLDRAGRVAVLAVAGVTTGEENGEGSTTPGQEQQYQQQQWGIWRLPLCKVVNIIAALDDPSRIIDEAPLSDRWIERHGEDGKKVIEFRH